MTAHPEPIAVVRIKSPDGRTPIVLESEADSLLEVSKRFGLPMDKGLIPQSQSKAVLTLGGLLKVLNGKGRVPKFDFFSGETPAESLELWGNDQLAKKCVALVSKFRKILIEEKSLDLKKAQETIGTKSFSLATLQEIALCAAEELVINVKYEMKISNHVISMVAPEGTGSYDEEEEV